MVDANRIGQRQTLRPLREQFVQAALSALYRPLCKPYCGDLLRCQVPLLGKRKVRLKSCTQPPVIGDNIKVFIATNKFKVTGKLAITRSKVKVESLNSPPANFVEEVKTKVPALATLLRISIGGIIDKNFTGIGGLTRVKSGIGEPQLQ